MHAFITNDTSLLAASPDQSGKIKSIRRIKGVYAIPDTLILVVQWKDGAEDTVDMTPIIQQSAPLRHLENTEIFSQVTVIDWGCGVGWPDDLGCGTDTLHALINKQAQHPTAKARISH